LLPHPPEGWVPSIPGYDLLGLLGQGGMGQVSKARNQRLDRLVALKVIRGERLTGPQAVTRFEREAQAAARLQHGNIVTVYHAGEANGVHYLEMESVAGVSLPDLVRQQGLLPVAVACD
jgi:eukaryotic-like serine/threonine-protein kinase